MCVAVVQKTPKDYSAIPGAVGFEVGDVIQVLEDDHDFSPLDLVDRETVYFPGVSIEQMNYLVLQDEQPSALALLLKMPGIGLSVAMTNRDVKKKRRYKIDLTSRNVIDKSRG